jgi:hypothetical protein
VANSLLEKRIACGSVTAHKTIINIFTALKTEISIMLQELLPEMSGKFNYILLPLYHSTLNPIEFSVMYLMLLLFAHLNWRGAR